MKYIDEFRDASLARNLINKLESEVQAGREYRLMEFCGGHTHTIFRYGLPDLLPENIRMMHGPGCPVCVLPMHRIDAAIELALEKGVILCSYGDMLRVPGAHRMSLQKAQGQGADIRMIYSPMDALSIALQHPDREVVFFAIGFETTTPPTAAVLAKAESLKLRNFSIFCNHVLTPAAMQGILDPAEKQGKKILDGLIGPGHVSLITGYGNFNSIASTYRLPLVITGFEPVDLLQSILWLVKQCNSARYEVENQYSRAVSLQGNSKAQRLTEHYFETRPLFEWRGLGKLRSSALQLREAHAFWDAERRFDLGCSDGRDNKACECPAVLRGEKNPFDCKLFDNGCTPENPVGSCMVSSEGACAAYYRYRRPLQRRLRNTTR